MSERAPSSSSSSIPTLSTERLTLRPFTLADVSAIVHLAGAREIAETTLNIPHPYEDRHAIEWIETHEPSFTEDRNANWAAVLTETSELIGAVSLIFTPAHDRAEMGYWTGVPFWGKGYCTEAARAVLEYAFSERKLARVFAHHFSRNPASGAVMKKLGMTYEGTLRKHVKKWDELEDAVFYGILREEFKTTDM